MQAQVRVLLCSCFHYVEAVRSVQPGAALNDPKFGPHYDSAVKSH